MSDLFDQLYDEAVSRDHAIINRINMIQQSYSPGFVRASAIVSRLDEYHQMFEDQLSSIVSRHRMRVRKGRYICPLCKKSDCPDAVFVVDVKLVMTPAELSAYLNNFPQG